MRRKLTVAVKEPLTGPKRLVVRFLCGFRDKPGGVMRQHHTRKLGVINSYTCCLPAVD